MNANPGVLIALDDSDASKHALDQVGHALAGEHDVTVHLLHVAGPLPGGLLEHGGSSDADEEARLERELDAEEKEWLAEERDRFQPVFQDAQRRLVAAGLDPHLIATDFCDAIPEDDLAHLILEEARRHGCETVVVGRTAYPWYRERFHRHVGAWLQEHTNGMQVEVVP